MITTDVENYPGYPNGIMGPAMMDDFRSQAMKFGTRVVDEPVTRVNLDETPFRVYAEEQEYTTRTLIVATGADAKWTGVPGEKEFGGHGVSACATCDGFFFRGKDVIVVGGGDTAMEEATFLTRHASKVFVVHRRDQLRASKIMQDRAMRNPKIEFLWNTHVTRILGETSPIKKVTGVELTTSPDGAAREMRIDGVFIAIGHKPNSELVAKWVDIDDLGYIKTAPHSTKTRTPGVFACGDVMDRVFRQAVTAAGTGCMAAIEAERFLEAEH